MFKHPLNKNRRDSEGLSRINISLKKNQLYLQAIKQQLPVSLAEHCNYAVLNKNKLIVYTDSPIWASKLLYSRIQIIDAISKQFCEPVQALTIKVNNLNSSIPQIKPIKPSPATINQLSEITHSGATDPVTDALKNLINVLKK